ncbi:uncharacterized protein DDB_G0284459-like [Dreissena polymorpha]|uniref:Uncharacterized protein n=1 Tax=Dreissena polymorpha TaxID=45954 RepID=A0A9D4LT23_DREPO|nr:uncharacterized protein DDB_G0284459-like [Dreissena polymorpha]KAH3863262.1 hypothetical protein DPMN_026242 [Dreissena polymorpha]
MQTNIQRSYGVAINTPKKQGQIPVPDTPTPGDMSVSFLASTPKPGCPQLSRRRPASIDSSPDVQKRTTPKAGKVATLSRSRNQSSPSKPSPRKAGGSLEEKMASIARSRLEKKHRRASVASDKQESSSETHDGNVDSQEHADKDAVQTMPTTFQVRKKRKVSVSVLDDIHPRSADQRAASVAQKPDKSVRNSINEYRKNKSRTKNVASFNSGNASVIDRQRSASTDSLSVDDLHSSHTFKKDTSALFMTRKKSVESTGTHDGSIVDANNNSPVKQDRNATNELHTSKNMSNNSRIKKNNEIKSFQTARDRTTGTANSKISTNETVTETPRTIKTKRAAIQNGKGQSKTLPKDGQRKLANTIQKPVDASHSENENSQKTNMPSPHIQGSTETAGSRSKKRCVEPNNVSGLRQLAKRTKRQRVEDETDTSVNNDMPVDDDGNDTGGSSQDDHGESVKSKEKKGPIDVEIVLDMVTSNVQARMTDCESAQEYVALKLWKKYLTEDMAAMIKDVHNVAALQNEVKLSQHRIKQQQRHLMRIQNERMQLELDVGPVEKQAERNKDMAKINKFLSNLRQVFNKTGTKH